MFDGENGGGGKEKREEGQEGEEDKREWMVLSFQLCRLTIEPSKIFSTLEKLARAKVL